MSPRVTPEELAEVRALDAAATDGPWIVDPNAEDRTDVVSTTHRCAVCYVPDEESPDGEFIARMRDLGPRLAAEVERLTAERDAWKRVAVARGKAFVAERVGDRVTASLAHGEATQAIRDLAALEVDKP